MSSILEELETVKARLAAQAGGGTQRFLDQMEAWLAAHPHAGPVSEDEIWQVAPLTGAGRGLKLLWHLAGGCEWKSG